ncbi:hypothetical protein J2P12_00680 [Candidatus Bathyarchaeota archaeon]|nr:hypothetical protein [Candidatus Bathyarchaeota archaeon]
MKWLVLLLVSIPTFAQITVSGGITVTGGISVSAQSSSVASQENLYCGAGDVASFGGLDGPATLPTACVYTAVAGSPSPGTVRTAANCGDIATKLAAVSNNSGDIVVIPASLGKCTGTWSVSYQGNSTHWLTIRTDQTGSTNFPAEGVRSSPCQINITHIDGYPDYSCSSPSTLMPTLSSTGSNVSALKLVGATYVRVIGIAFTKEHGANMQNALVDLTSSDHVILDRVLIHGEDWSAYDPAHSTKVGVTTKGTYQAVINSWVYDIDYSNPDGQAIIGGIGTQSDEGPIKLYNNLLAGSSETWIWGGGAAVAWPHDIEIRWNLSMKPLKWMMPIGASIFSGPNQQVPNVKNLGEFKHAHRILIENNVAMNNWEGQSDQFGSVWLTLPKNQAPQNTANFVNTSGTAVSCASDNTGTPCAAHTGQWGNRIVSMSRTSGVVTVNLSTDGGFPFYNSGDHVVFQGIPSQVVSGVDMASFNGEQTLGCSPSACTDGFNVPNVMYFSAAGSDFALTTLLTTPTQPLAQDFTASTCASPGHCYFAAPTQSYPNNPIASVQDSEHITVTISEGVQTGVSQQSCHPGRNPHAQVQDETIRYNYLTHAESVGLALSNAVSNCTDITQGVSNVSIHDNVMDDLDTTAWNRSAGSCCGHGGDGVSIGNGAPQALANYGTSNSIHAHDILIAHNTFAGLRGWTNAGSSGYGWNDGFNVAYTGLTVKRTSNVVTITFNTLSGINPALQTVITGFKGGYSDINGTWTITQQLPTSITFTESGSHADFSTTTISSGTTGAAKVGFPLSYYKNVTVRDNFLNGPLQASNWNGGGISGGVASGLSLNMCDPNTSACTWTLKNNVITTQTYVGYSQTATVSYPATNPDASSTCTVTGTCFITNFSTAFNGWNLGLGNTLANDYSVTSNYLGAGSDGRDIGANISQFVVVRNTIPHFTFTALTITTVSLTSCTNGVYCEQQLAWSGGASPFVQWHLTSGTLPTGMSFSNGDGANTCKVNGSFSKTGPTGCAGWIYGTPTQTGNFSLTFQAEDAAHQIANASLSLTVN